MKAIRIATLAAALCVGMTSVAAAQGAPPQGQGQGEMRRGGGMGGMLLKDINLTDEAALAERLAFIARRPRGEKEIAGQLLGAESQVQEKDAGQAHKIPGYFYPFYHSSRTSLLKDYPI